MIGLGSGPMGDLIGIDYFHLTAGLFNVIGLFGFWGTTFIRVSLDGTSGLSAHFKSLGLFVIACGGVASTIFLLGMAGANSGLIEVAYTQVLPIDQFGGSLLLIAMGIMVASIPALARRYDSWLDRRYPRT